MRGLELCPSRPYTKGVLEEKRARYVEIIPDDILVETSEERFDRIAFAERALAILRPKLLTVALCKGVARVRVEVGREWSGAKGARWAILSVPPRASRRAIALAVAGLGTGDAKPYALDVLLSESTFEGQERR